MLKIGYLSNINKKNMYRNDNLSSPQFSLNNGKPPPFTSTYPVCKQNIYSPVAAFYATPYKHFTHIRERRKRKARRDFYIEHQPSLTINSPLVYDNNTLNAGCICALCRQKQIYVAEKSSIPPPTTVSSTTTTTSTTTPTTALYQQIELYPSLITEIKDEKGIHEYRNHQHQQRLQRFYTSQFYDIYRIP